MGNTNSERKKGSQVRASVFGLSIHLTASSTENGFPAAASKNLSLQIPYICFACCAKYLRAFAGMEGRIQAFAGMDERAMGGQVRTSTKVEYRRKPVPTERDTIVFNLPVNTVFRRYEITRCG